MIPSIAPKRDRVGVLQLVAHLALPIRGIQRRRDRTRQHSCVKSYPKLPTIREENRDLLSGLDVGRDHSGRCHLNHLAVSGIGNAEGRRGRRIDDRYLGMMPPARVQHNLMQEFSRGISEEPGARRLHRTCHNSCRKSLSVYDAGQVALPGERVRTKSTTRRGVICHRRSLFLPPVRIWYPARRHL